MPSVNDEERLRYERGEDPWSVSDWQDEARELPGDEASQDAVWSRRVERYEASVSLLFLLLCVGLFLLSILS